MQYLFERLAQAEGEPAHLGARERLQIDVMRQIQCIVAARPLLGSAATDASLDLLSFGAEAVTDLARGNAQELARYGRRLEKLIAHYEPRLEHASVTVEPGGSLMSPFKIVVSGSLPSEDGLRKPTPVSFEARPPHR